MDTFNISDGTFDHMNQDNLAKVHSIKLLESNTLQSLCLEGSIMCNAGEESAYYCQMVCDQADVKDGHLHSHSVYLNY